MHETINSIFSIGGGILVGIILCTAYKLFRKGRADTDNQRIEELERGAAEDNRTLGEEERRTDTILEDQAADNRQSGEINRRARELIKRAEEILKGKSSG